MEKIIKTSECEMNITIVQWTPAAGIEIDAIDIDLEEEPPCAIFLLQDALEHASSDTLHEFLKDELHF